MASPFHPPKTLTAQLLREGADIADGARNTTHGSKERSFACIAELWTLYLHHRYGSCPTLNAEDVAWLMALMKLARRLYGTPIKDHALDGAVYTAMTWELHQKDPEDEKG